MRKIDKSMQGLKKVLKDKTLFREYAEFCKNECCVENTVSFFFFFFFFFLYIYIIYYINYKI